MTEHEVDQRRTWWQRNRWRILIIASLVASGASLSAAMAGDFAQATYFLVWSIIFGGASDR